MQFGVQPTLNFQGDLRVYVRDLITFSEIRLTGGNLQLFHSFFKL